MLGVGDQAFDGMPVFANNSNTETAGQETSVVQLDGSVLSGISKIHFRSDVSGTPTNPITVSYGGVSKEVTDGEQVDLIPDSPQTSTGFITVSGLTGGVSVGLYYLTVTYVGLQKTATVQQFGGGTISPTTNIVYPDNQAAGLPTYRLDGTSLIVNYKDWGAAAATPHTYTVTTPETKTFDGWYSVSSGARTKVTTTDTQLTDGVNFEALFTHGVVDVFDLPEGYHLDCNGEIVGNINLVSESGNVSAYQNTTDKSLIISETINGVAITKTYIIDNGEYTENAVGDVTWSYKAAAVDEYTSFATAAADVPIASLKFIQATIEEPAPDVTVTITTGGGIPEHNPTTWVTSDEGATFTKTYTNPGTGDTYTNVLTNFITECGSLTNADGSTSKAIED